MTQGLPRRLRVAMIGSFFPQSVPGGMQNYVMGRATWLGRRCDVRVFAMGPVPAEYTPVTPGSGAGRTASDSLVSRRFRAVSLGPAIGIRFQFLQVWWRLCSGLLRFWPDAIELHYPAVAMPLLIGTSFTYFFHGPLRLETRVQGGSEALQRQRYRIEGWFLRRARRIRVASRTFHGVLLAEHPGLHGRPRDIRLCYPRILGAEQAAASEDFVVPLPDGVPERARLLICVRRLVPRTGVDLLLRAFERASASLPSDVHLVVAGTGPLEASLQALQATLASAPRIHLVGQIDDAARAALFHRAEWNVVPTVALEGFGLVVVEAAFHGCPSLVTRVDALPEVVELLGGHGKVCAPDEASLAAALCEVCGEAGRFADGAALRAVAIRHFGAEAGPLR